VFTQTEKGGLNLVKKELRKLSENKKRKELMANLHLKLPCSLQMEEGQIFNAGSRKEL
jgi:hypothetical protein